MHKTAIVGSLALLAMAPLVSGRAEAGASASAASKYTNSTKQVAAANPVRQARSADSDHRILLFVREKRTRPKNR